MRAGVVRESGRSRIQYRVVMSAAGRRLKFQLQTRTARLDGAVLEVQLAAAALTPSSSTQRRERYPVRAEFTKSRV